MNKNIEKIFVNQDDTIKEVIEKINKAPLLGLPSGIALVVKEEDLLQGVVTDGDIRRAIINGIDINQKVSEIMTSNPITVLDTMSPDVMLKVIKKQIVTAITEERCRDKKIDKVIVVDKDNKIVDVKSFFNIWKNSDAKLKNVCVIGMGYVGLTLAVTLADIGFTVIGIENNEKIINNIRMGKSHVHEKNLDFLLKRNINNNLLVSQEISSDNYDIYVICVGTPIESDHRADLKPIESVSSDIGKVLKDQDLIIIRSTVPIGTCRNVVRPILEKKSNLICGKDFNLSFAPERTVEGRALEELRTLPQIIGGFSKSCVDVTSNFFRNISPNIVAVDSLEEAEMVKLLNNTFRDVSFAFANELVFICDKFNLNAAEIIKAASDGYPRNTIPLPGFVGGYCLKKDPYIYSYSTHNSEVLSELALKSRQINEKLPNYALSKIESFMKKYNKSEKDSKIFILGFAFKGVPETTDMRHSPTLDLLNLLKQGNWKNICGFDPVISKEDIDETGVISCSLEEGFEGADIVMIMNNHQLYNKLDIVSLLKRTNKFCLFFDGWSLFNPKEILKVEKIIYQGMGITIDKI